MLRYLIILSFLGISAKVYSQQTQKQLISPRMRIIIDNDFSGDPDGLFQLVHHLLSPSVEIRAIIGSHLKTMDGFDTSRTTASHSRLKIEEVLKIMKIKKTFPVLEGSNTGLVDINNPPASAAAEAIIAEAMRTDTQLPLYIVCGAGLTDLSIALINKPEIAPHLTLIWIGGPEYAGLALPPPGYTPLEYNLGIDIRAARFVFNQSLIPVWQVPRSTYRQVLFPYSSLVSRIKKEGKIGEFLTASIENIMRRTAKFNLNLGETYILGDSPLVLLTALQSSFEADPSSSGYDLRPAPLINEAGLYEVNAHGRNIRVYKSLDVRLIFEDLFNKLSMFNQ